MTDRKILIGSILGNALEFYDFTLYGVFAAVIAGQFFPGGDDTTRLLASLAAFAVGFLARPIGAVFFGHIGDKMGRKKALSFSVLLMGIPTLVMGLLPSYAEIGIWASLTIALCRVFQGICTGGEYSGAAIFALEHAGKARPGFVGGLITGSCVVGAFLATFLGSLTERPGSPEWAWRLPFILGAFVSVVGYFIRRNLLETPEFLARGRSSLKVRSPLISAFRAQPYSCLSAFVLGGFNGALSYTLFGFLNIYLSRYLEVPRAVAMQWNLLGLFFFMVGSPWMGHLLDRWGRKAFLVRIHLALLGVLVPIFMLLSSREMPLILVGQVLLGLCVASIAGSMHAILQTLFPTAERYSGVAFNFSLGMGIFGGLTPMIYIQMIEKMGASLLFPGYFLMGVTLLSALTVMNSSRYIRISYPGAG